MSSQNPGPVLLIMAAGRGQRYGGLKQFAPVGPSGESLLEYLIYDALSTGFAKIILVICSDQKYAFQERFAARISIDVDIEFALQATRPVTSQDHPQQSPRSWGTAHAVLAARHLIGSPFAVANSDDFYGRPAIRTLRALLCQMDRRSASLPAVLIGYCLENTLSETGAVSRGICQVDCGQTLRRIAECRGILRRKTGIVFIDKNGVQRLLNGDEIVSMNLWGFSPEVFNDWARHFQEFLESVPPDGVEFEIPTAVQQMVDAGKLNVRVVETDEDWCGLTYAGDLPTVRKRIAALVDRGIYPRRLWDQSPRDT